MSKLSHLKEVIDWVVHVAPREPGIHGVLLVGSYGRDLPRQESDIDLIFLVEEKERYLTDLRWTDGLNPLGKIAREEWGALTALRVIRASGPEVELGLVNLSWANMNPLDPGTERVLRNGVKILYDPNGILGQLIQSISST